jgi:hypothetical protein
LPIGSGRANATYAAAAHIDFMSAFAEIGNRVENVLVLTETPDLDLGNRTLTPGLYSAGTSLQVAIGQNLTLSGQGVYVFKMGTSLLGGDCFVYVFVFCFGFGFCLILCFLVQSVSFNLNLLRDFACNQARGSQDKPVLSSYEEHLKEIDA